MSARTLERAKEWTEHRRAEGLRQRSGVGDSLVMYPADNPPPEAASWDGWPVEWNVPRWNAPGTFPEYVFGRVATVFCCADLIGRSLASMDLLVSEESVLLPPPAWTENPEPEVYTNAGEWVRATVNSLLIRGEAFVIASARYNGGSGLPARFFTANPDLIEVNADRGGVRYSVAGEELPRDDVLHIRYQIWPGVYYRGIGPLMAAALNLIGAEAMAHYGADLASRGGVPWGALKHPANLNAKQATDLREAWLAAVADRRGAPAVLSGGIELEMFHLSPREMSLLELRQWDEQRIAACFGVPPYLIGLPQPEGSMTYNNVQGLFDFFWRSMLRPLAQNIGDALSAWSLPPGTDVSFDADEYVRPGMTEQANAYATLIASGVLSAEEVRVLLNLPTPSDPHALAIATSGVA